MQDYGLQSRRPPHTKDGGASAVDPKAHSRVVKDASVLIIDDDRGTRQTFERILRLEGFRAATAGTGEEGIELARLVDFDVILVDLRLTDMSGIDALSVLREFCSARLVLISAFLTVHTAVDAMKLGAFDVVEKPLDVEGLLAVVRQATKQSDAPFFRPVWKEPPCDRVITTPRSIVERWVGYVWKVCDPSVAEAGGDFKTLEEWAHRVAVSYTTLCETCRLLGFRPLDARDFARTLSALRTAVVHGCAPDVLLNVSNRRGLRALSVKAGVELETEAEESSVLEFLTTQRFIPLHSEAVRLIHTLISDWLFQRRNERHSR
jgi:DNA-binding response OmpR family regulator